MDANQRKTLQRMSAGLFDSFEPVDLLPYLLVQDLVTDKEVTDIRNESDQRFRVAELLKIVQNKFSSIDPFLEALHNCGYPQIAERLSAELAELPPSPAPRKAPGVVEGRKAEFDSPTLPPSPTDRHTAQDTSKPPQDPITTPTTSVSQQRHPLQKQRSTMFEGGRVKRVRQFFEAKEKGSPAEVDFKFLAQNTRFSAGEISAWFKEFVRACPQGKLNKEQFVKFYKEIDPESEFSDKYCHHVFRCFDTDRLGFIDFKEFLLALNIKLNGTPEQKLEWTFRLYDIDGNGKIDLEEMVRITENLYEMIKDDPEEEDTPPLEARDCAVAIFERMDEDGNGWLTRGEFVHGCLRDPNLFAILTSTATIS